LGTLKKLLLSDGFKIDTINAQTEVIANNLDRYGGIIILGGPMAVYDNLPFLLQEQSLIKSAISKNLPTLGICLGSQLIAQAAGGQVYKGKKKEIGWHEVSLTPAGRKDIFRGISSGKKPKVFQWHGDTYDLPSGAQVLAKTDLYPQAFRVGSAIGIQFHIEVTKEMIELWMQEYREEIRSEDQAGSNSSNVWRYRKFNVNVRTGISKLFYGPESKQITLFYLGSVGVSSHMMGMQTRNFLQ